MKMKALLCLGLILLGVQVTAQRDSLNAKNAKGFFEKLAANKGYWVANNSQFKKGDTQGFPTFLMHFEKDELGGVSGTIYGVNQAQDTVPFWRTLEFVDPHSGEVHFVQHGNVGFAMSSALFTANDTRETAFELTYYSGVKEKHRDSHTFINERTIETTSATFDPLNDEWIEGPKMRWKWLP